MPGPPKIKPVSTPYKGIKYVGKLHLMVLHFPIALLLAGSLVQWHQVIRIKGGSAVPVLLWFGAIGAVATAALGWMFAYDSVYFGEDENLLFCTDGSEPAQLLLQCSSCRY